MITNLSQLKQHAQKYVFTMIRHDWYPDGKLIGIPRKVEKLQTNSMKFEGGSWLDFRAAKNYKFEGDKITVSLNDDGSFTEVMEYQLTEVA